MLVFVINMDKHVSFDKLILFIFFSVLDSIVHWGQMK